MDERLDEADRLDALARAGSTEAQERLAALLPTLSFAELGLVWRYVPGGTFQMGSDTGEADERPVHPVTLTGFWMTDAPISWAHHCALLDWEPPPKGAPRDLNRDTPGVFNLSQENKIRRQYCEDHTLRARDWHAHAPEIQWQRGNEILSSTQLFGAPARDGAEAWTWSEKPMVSVSVGMAQELAAHLSTRLGAAIGLPTEAQWERAARGGLEGRRHPWGDEPPTPERCDFDNFTGFVVRPSRSLPANGYGLYAMCGGVWEWCEDHYLSTGYRLHGGVDPCVKLASPEAQHVLRGGSWADCADAVTVSFRMCLASAHWRAKRNGSNANVGFRLVRAR